MRTGATSARVHIQSVRERRRVGNDDRRSRGMSRLFPSWIMKRDPNWFSVPGHVILEIEPTNRPARVAFHALDPLTDSQ